jgi:hypothetical protein
MTSSGAERRGERAPILGVKGALRSLYITGIGSAFMHERKG